ncbi:MAG: helix-turn-helix domain-containing protein [Bacteroidota bacterium]
MSFFAKNIRFLREQRELTQAEFALLVDLWEDTIDRYEKSKLEPDLETLVRISDSLNVPLDHLLKRNLELQDARIQARNIRLILLDVDGTLTDGGMYYSESGDQMKRFYTKDGLIIHRLISRKNLQFGFISSGSTEYLMKKRAETLGVQHLYAGTQPKVKIVDQWLAKLNLRYEHLAYVGDDLNDLPLIKQAGIAACPADAVPAVKRAAHIVLHRKGGHGCVREFLEEILGYDVEE